MSDHEDHETYDPMEPEEPIRPEEEDELPPHFHSQEAADDMDVDVEYPDYSMEEEEGVDQEKAGLWIATLYFTNGLSQDTTEIKVYAEKDIVVGREEDPDSSRYIIADWRVSKKHFRIYSIIYEQSELDKIQPLIYCEDLESTNGTYINDECIGKFGLERRGYLLNDDDVIEVKPYWKYLFRQRHKPSEVHHSGYEVKDLEYFSDRYSITNRLLGSGQYGTVYLAKELVTSRQVACKIINIKDAEKGAMSSGGGWGERRIQARTERARVLREVTILGKLSHPHILDLRKAFCSNDFIYMFTELAPAGDLFSYCDARGGKLCDVEGRIICRQIALALEYMHAKQIAHRDIKKENVLIMQTYTFSCRVVLTDFGFANHLDAKTRRMFSKVGTDDYAAPEVEAIDSASDGYTLAVDMYSLGKLTLNMLYGDTSSISREIYSRQSQENIERFTKGLEIEGLTDRANKFLRGLLHHNPAKRMTVQQALQHSWFKMPRREAIAIDDAFKRINKSWKPREDFDTVIEDLPDRQVLRQASTSISVSRKTRRLPEVHPYPFIGLDNRLNPRVQPSRAMLLHDLKQKGSLFVNENSEKAVESTRVLPRKQVTRIESVLGTDLFGTKSSSNLNIQGRVNRKNQSRFEPMVAPDSSLSSLAEEDGNQDSDEGVSSVSASMAEYSLQGDSQNISKESESSIYSNNPWAEQVEREPRSMVERSPHFKPSVRGDGFEPEELAGNPPRNNIVKKTYGSAGKRSTLGKRA